MGRILFYLNRWNSTEELKIRLREIHRELGGKVDLGDFRNQNMMPIWEGQIMAREMADANPNFLYVVLEKGTPYFQLFYGAAVEGGIPHSVIPRKH